MRMAKFKTLLAVACAVIYMGTTTVYASALTQNDLAVDQETKGEQTFLTSAQLSQLENKTGSIQVELTDGKSGTKKEGIKITVQKVASVEQGEYVLVDEYKESAVDFTTIENANDLQNAAQILQKVEAKKENTKETDSQGKVLFEKLEVGVYLIAAEDSESYDTVTPTIVAIPTWDETEGDMLYDLVIEPKHTAKPDKTQNAPQTGLEDHTRIYVIVMICCLAGAIGIGIRLHTLRKK